MIISVALDKLIDLSNEIHMPYFCTTKTCSEARHVQQNLYYVMNNTTVWKHISANSPLSDHKSAALHFLLFAPDEVLVAPRDH